MIIEKIKEFFNRIFKGNKTKRIAEQSEVLPKENERNEFLESIKVDKRALEEEVLNSYNINMKEDFFRLYDDVKNGRVSCEILPTSWIMKINIMMQEELLLSEENE